MEAAIAAAEAKVAAARASLEDPAVAADAAELGKRHERLAAAEKQVADLFARWEDLAARN
jgi:hypothetical protein